MLPPELRLRHGDDFRAVVRRGRRFARGPLVVFVRAREQVPTFGASVTSDGGQLPSAGPRFGLVVSRAVGNSVTRHRVSRRLRAQLYQRRDLFPVGHDVVVRAQPEAAHATSDQLGASLDAAVSRMASSRTAATRAGRP